MIFNELEYANKMLEKGFIQNNYSKELRILAKYYNKELGLKTEAVKTKLKDFCLKYLPKYNEVLHLEMIIKASQYGVKKKNRLLIISYIPITKSELKSIESLNDIKLETFAFCALVLSKVDKLRKFNNDKKYIYYCNNLKEMFVGSKIRCNKEQRELYIDQLSQTQLFDYTIFGTLKINFVNELDEIELEIKNYDNFVLEYAKYKGENVQYCEVCGNPFLPSNNRQKFCKKCWDEKRKNDINENAKKYYYENVK